MQRTPESKSDTIARILEGEIRAGILHDGAPLESESALVQRFGVSRTTVRKGLALLTAKGLIQTRTGIGSFVTYGGAVIDGRLGWSVALSQKDTQLGVRILRIARTGMDLSMPHITIGNDVLAVDRIRFREDSRLGLTLERSRIPWRPGFNAVLDRGLLEGSLSKTMEHCGLRPVSGEEWANVLPALAPSDAALMGRVPGEPMMILRRLTRARGGAVVEYVESLLDPHVFGLHMEF